MSLCKGNALPKKGTDHTLYNGPSDKGGINQIAGCLIKIKGYKTYRPTYTIDDVSHSNIILCYPYHKSYFM